MESELHNGNASHQPIGCNDTIVRDPLSLDSIVIEPASLDNVVRDPFSLVVNDADIKLEVKQEDDYEENYQNNDPNAIFSHETIIFKADTDNSLIKNSSVCYGSTTVLPLYDDLIDSMKEETLPAVAINLENNVVQTAIAVKGKGHEKLIEILTAGIGMAITTDAIPSTSSYCLPLERCELLDQDLPSTVDESDPDNSDIDLYWEMKKTKCVCKLCNKSFLEIEMCRTHIRSHLGLKPFVCNQSNCKKAFASKHYLQNHINSIHINYGKYKCGVCKRTFNKRSRLFAHLDKHSGRLVMPFECANCGKTFTNKNSIFKHIDNIHNGVKTQNLCEVCGKVFHNRDSLLSHRRVHKEKRYKCDKCTMSFTFPGKLSNHMSSHSKERSFLCDVCLKTFRSKTSLVRHITMFHRGKRKVWKCTKCEKSFQSRDFWKEHLLKHEGIRKYSCETCGKTFAQSSHLAAHKFSHGEKKFVCSICGAKFNRNDNMKSHVKRHETKKVPRKLT